MHLRHPLVLALAVLLPMSGSAAPRENITLEQLLSSPFPTSLVASPTGDKVAWVFNDRGRRNVWIAEPPEYKGRKLTSCAEDDGQELTGLAWTPDGNHICYVRGNGSHGGETLNPRSTPTVADQTVWI